MYHRCVYFQDSAYEYYRMGCERGHPRACLHAGVMDTYAPGVPITLTGNESFQVLPSNSVYEVPATL